MCIVMLGIEAHPEMPIIIASNRDEYQDRPTKPMAYWEDRPDILSSMDLRKGGAWFGVTKEGRFAVVTNVRLNEEDTSNPPSASRGLLVKAFLESSRDPAEFAKTTLSERQHHQYNLIVGDITTRNFCYISSRKGCRPKTLQPGVFCISNGYLESQWEKVERGRKLFREALGEAKTVDALHDQLHVILQNTVQTPDVKLPTDSLLPSTAERQLSSIFVRVDHLKYGTRESTSLVLDKHGVVSVKNRYLHDASAGLMEKFWQVCLGKPVPQQWQDQHYEFMLGER